MTWETRPQPTGKSRWQDFLSTARCGCVLMTGEGVFELAGCVQRWQQAALRRSVLILLTLFCSHSASSFAKQRARFAASGVVRLICSHAFATSLSARRYLCTALLTWLFLCLVIAMLLHFALGSSAPARIALALLYDNTAGCTIHDQTSAVTAF